MNDQSSMFDPPTLPGSTSAISSPESAAGPTPSDLPDGPTTAQSGPAPVPVSRFRARDSKKAMPTNDTSGPLFTNSSPSASLQRSLENRLRARMAGNGSPEYALTWKTHDMPSGPPICALRASGRRTSGKDFSGWPSPQTRDHHAQGANHNPKAHSSSLATVVEKKAPPVGWPTPMATERTSSPETMAKRLAYRKGNGQNTVPLYLNEVAQTAGWPTPRVSDQAAGRTLDNEGRRVSPSGLFGANLSDLAQTAGWPTPMAGTPAQNGNNAAGNNDSSRKTVELVSGWPTPNAISEKRGGLQTNPEAALRRRAQGHMLNLDDAATLATGWATPRATDGSKNGRTPEGALKEANRKGGNNDLGTTAALSPAPTASKGASLNPAFSLWLMGYPIEWARCAERVTRSSRKSRQSS
jgi:hypothetical protein